MTCTVFAKGVVFSQAEGAVWLGDREVKLTPKASAILSHLLQRDGRLVTADELLDAVWPGTHIQPEAIKVYIHEIRQALGDDPKHPAYIETVPRRGYRLIRPVEPATAGSLPVRPGLFGRAGELCRLNRSLRLAGAAIRQIVFISGEAGMGKTALVEAFADSVSPGPDLHVAGGRCINIRGRQEPYYPVLEALGRLRVTGLAAKLAAYAPSWAAQMPWMFTPAERERILHETSSATAGRMLREACEFFEMLSRDATVVLILEDVHWADTATADFISAVAQRTGTARLILVCTLRSADLAAGRHPLTQAARELQAKSLCCHLELKPLDQADVRAMLVREFHGRFVPGNLARRVAQYSGGNPLFVSSIGRRLLETGFQEGMDLEASADLQQFLYGGFAGMNAGDRELMEYAAVAGVTFTGWFLAPLLGTDSASADARYEALAETCSWLKLAGTETSPGYGLTTRFEFRHALYRDVICRRMGRARRDRIQRILAGKSIRYLGLAAAQRTAGAFEAHGLPR